MIRLLSLTVVLLQVGLVLSARDLIDAETAHGFSGETTRSGMVSVSMVPAPGLEPDVFTLRLHYRLDAHNPGDWIDVSRIPTPPADLSDTDRLRLWVRAEQPTDFLHLKLVDPQNPGTNHSAFEGTLTHEGSALPAAEWVAVEIPLPEAVDRRDGLTYIGFYISASDPRVPLNRDIVVHVGRFPYTIPARPPWPPEARAESRGESLRPVWSGPLESDGPWILVTGPDNQTDHTARFRAGGVEFHADALGWNEYLWSDADRLVIKPQTTYRLQFDYHLLSPPGGDPDAIFYALVRARGTIREDVGWQRWTGAAGSRGRRLITFTTHDKAGYYLNMGIRHHGAIRVENLRLWEVVTGEEE